MRSVLLSSFLLAVSPALAQPTPEDQQLRDAAKTETYRDLTDLIADINEKRTAKPEPLAGEEPRSDSEKKAPEPKPEAMHPTAKPTTPSKAAPAPSPHRPSAPKP